MDALRVLSSLNIIGIVFFALTLGALFFEIFAFRKEKKTKKTTIKLPDFDPNLHMAATPHSTPIKVVESEVSTPRANGKTIPKPIIITAVILVVVGLATALSFFAYQANKNAPTANSPSANPTPPPRLLSSNGIKIFDANWQVLSPEDISSLAAGTLIYVGIETVASPDVTQARIRVNESEWKEDHVTGVINPDENVYFVEYTIPDGVATLKFEAQLYSAYSGWPK